MFTGLALYVRGLMSNRVLCRASLATVVPHGSCLLHCITVLQHSPKNNHRL